MNKRLLGKVLREVRTIENVLPNKKRHVITKESLSKAAFLRIGSETFSVVEKFKFKEGRWVWFELKLFSLKDGRTLFLEYEEDDELEITLYDRSPRFKDLNIDGRDLEYFDDEEEGSFQFEGKTFFYEESDKALRFSDEDPKGESFYYWEFEDEEGEVFLSVEKWDDEYEVSIGHEVEETEVEILSKRSNS